MGIFTSSIDRAKLGFVQLKRRADQLKNKKLNREEMVYLFKGVDTASDLFSEAALVKLNGYLQEFKKIVTKKGRITREADNRLAWIDQNLEQT